MKTLALLYSELVPMAVPLARLQTLFPDARAVCADTMTDADLRDVDVLLNALGSAYREETFGAVAAFYERGGSLLCVGARAFSQPYTGKGGKVAYLEPTVAAIRALGPVEQYIDTPLSGDEKPVVPSAAYAFLRPLAQSGALSGIGDCVSCLNNFSNAAPSDDPESPFMQDASLEVAFALADGKGRRTAAPIVVIEPLFKGAWAMLNFTPADEGFYLGESGAALLTGMAEHLLAPRVLPQMESRYARYLPGMPDEAPVLEYSVRRLDQTSQQTAPVRLKLTLLNRETGLPVLAQEIPYTEETAEYTLYNMQEGLWEARLCVMQGETTLSERVTGFHVLDEQAMRRRLAPFKRVTVDASVTPDFMVCEGKPFAIHGTTYFVTDVFRRCFLHFNSALCQDELKKIKADGYNVIRTGNWQLNVPFYGEDGACSETAMRALESFFLLAAEQGLSVQFVLGSFMFNNWDRTKDPLHDPDTRRKVMSVIDAFTKRFAAYPNVMLDIINEPSYSYNGGWTLGRPSGDPSEKLHWTAFLKRRYGGDLTALRDAWRESAAAIPTFEAAKLPSSESFDRMMIRTNTDINYCPVTDFYLFARESYSGWVSEIRSIARKNAPAMVVMMGRDESIRIPSEQDEAALGSIDTVNWHQWGTNSIVWMEYLLNRVRGMVCCGQELGVYQHESLRGFKRLTPERQAAVLERKLLYSFGNWIQWQIVSDPYLHDICETSLGLYRTDLTQTPSAPVSRALAYAEERMAAYMRGRDEDASGILTLHPTSYYFSINNALAIQGVRSHALTLQYRLNRSFDLVLEQQFRRGNEKQFGDPDIVFVPAAQVMAGEAFSLLEQKLRAGKTVVVCGSLDKDEYFRPVQRMQQWLAGAHAEPILGMETLRVGEQRFTLDFRRVTGYADPGHIIDKSVLPGQDEPTVTITKIGQGTLIHCPLPIELAGSDDAIEAVYRFALEHAPALKPLPFAVDPATDSPAVMIAPLLYVDVIVYTVVNEGGDTAIRFTDTATGKTIWADLPAQRGLKLWLRKDGKLLAAYASRPFAVDGELYHVFTPTALLPGK